MQRKRLRYQKGVQGSRRQFIRGAIMGSASLLILPGAILRAREAGTPACTPTSPDVEGPFYRGGAPMRVALADPNEPGERLEITGTVFAKDCTTPLAGVMIDVWAANEAGCYYTFEGCTPTNDDFFNLRGRMTSAANGAYGFSTILPGRYPNAGTLRPRHLHFRITAPGRSPVITQLYFEGDEFIPGDPFADVPEAAARIIPLTRQNDTHTGRFDITLNVAPSTTGVDAGSGAVSNSALLACQPNPFREEARIQYQVATLGRAELSIYDVMGRKIKVLADSVHSPGSYADTWDGRDDSGARAPAGIYACRLRAGNTIHTMNMVLAE